MNAEKLIEELRKVEKYYFCSTVVHPSGLNVRMMAKNCADKLEELQAQLKLEHGGALAAAENCLRLQGEVNDLQAQLAEAQRRERAAVEDLNALRKKSGWTCKMNTEQAIKIIECFFRESDNKCANGECDFASPMCQYDREAAFEIALSALREKAEREGGTA